MTLIEKVVAALQVFLSPDRRKIDAGEGLIFLRILPRIECNDGFSLSVQAGDFIYCLPRDNAGPWSAVEVGFPSQIDDELMPYVEDEDEPTNTVYPYVPIEVVASVILKHGIGDSYELEGISKGLLGGNKSLEEAKNPSSI